MSDVNIQQLSPRLLQQMIDITPAAVYIFDLVALGNVFVNGELLNTLGYSPEEIQAMGAQLMLSLLHPDDRARADERVAALRGLADGASVDWEYRVRHADGGWRWLLSRESVFARDEAGAPTQVLGVAIDITGRREAEEELRHSRALLSQLEAQVIERERFVATGRLAASVAHEVNTPLQAIESCLHLAGRVADEAERARYLRLAREEIQRVGYTLRQLLDLYRPSGARVALDVNGLIERVLLLTGNSLGRQGIQVDRDLSSDLPPLIGRADEITQVLINLVFNAMQAMPKGGLLRLETARAQDEAGQAVLRIRVCDSGAGIAPELHEQIFEPFFTTRAEGTGLGLAVCRRIVDGHGGAIRVESEPGSGSCFIIEFSRP